MKKMQIFSLIALVNAGAACLSAPAWAEFPAIPQSVEPSQSAAAAQFRALLAKNAHGGDALTAAIANLLQRNPGAISDVVSVGAFNANSQQAVAIELGVIRAQAWLKNANPEDARYIQSYLEANKRNNIVAEILAGEQSEGSVDAAGHGNQNDNGNGNNGNGGGGGNGNGGCGNGKGQGHGHGNGNQVSCH